MRCVIVDDSQAFLDKAQALLAREGIEVVGVARTVGAAMQTVAACRPEVTLVDIDLGAESGFDLVRALSGTPAGAGSLVILISAHEELDFAELIAACHAAGFVSKLELSARAIREVLGR